MEDDAFWQTIALIDCTAADEDYEDAMRPALTALSALGPGAIEAFEDSLARKLFALDTRAHCRHCYAGTADPDDGDQYISSDDFLYARCFVVASGREFYERVERDPAAMPSDRVFEGLLDLAADAYEAATGEPFEHDACVSYESFSNADGWRPGPNTRTGTFASPDARAGNRRPA